MTPASASVADGQTLQLDATGYFSDGSTQDLTSTVTWSFSDPTLASISSSAGTSGLLTAGGVGTGTATAIDGFVAGTTDVTISPASQAIAFPATPVTYGQTDFSPAEASSGLPVGYSDPSGVPGRRAGAGSDHGCWSCTVTASQPGNAAYQAAAPVTETFQVAPAALFVDANDVSVAFGQTPTLGYSLSGFVNGENPTNAGVTGQRAAPRPGRGGSGQLLRGDHLHAGSLAASNYTFLTGASRTLTITKATQAVSVGPPPASPTVGGGYTVAATGGGSGNPVLLGIDSSSTQGACSLTNQTVSFTGVGSCVIDASQGGNTDYLAGQAQQSLTVGQGSQSITFTSSAPTGAVRAARLTRRARRAARPEGR